MYTKHRNCLVFLVVQQSQPGDGVNKVAACEVHNGMLSIIFSLFVTIYKIVFLSDHLPKTREFTVQAVWTLSLRTVVAVLPDVEF